MHVHATPQFSGEIYEARVPIDSTLWRKRRVCLPVFASAWRLRPVSALILTLEGGSFASFILANERLSHICPEGEDRYQGCTPRGGPFRVHQPGTTNAGGLG